MIPLCCQAALQMTCYIYCPKFNMKKFTAPPKATGFSLIEMAIVLFIVALLLGGLLPTVSGQIEQKRTAETLKQLDEIQQALIGYAIINDRLPCPASDLSNGEENPVGGGTCLNPYDGFVPAATLGLTTGVDLQGKKGFAIDAWNNRIHYSVTTSNSKAFTTAGGMSTSFSTLAPNLLVCSTGTGITNTSCSGNALTSSPGVPAVIFSTGKNGALGGAGLDETANLDGGASQTFVSHTFTPSTAANGEFDDLVTWISPNILINRMVTAGKLP